MPSFLYYLILEPCSWVLVNGMQKDAIPFSPAMQPKKLHFYYSKHRHIDNRRYSDPRSLPGGEMWAKTGFLTSHSEVSEAYTFILLSCWYSSVTGDFHRTHFPLSNTEIGILKRNTGIKKKKSLEMWGIMRKLISEP